MSFDTSELSALAGRLTDAGDALEKRLPAWLADFAGEAAAHMREEVPVDSGETADSITIEPDGDAFTVGPTNVDARGKPVGLFIEYGTEDTPPDPFVMRTGDWASEAIRSQSSDLLEGVL